MPHVQANGINIYYESQGEAAVADFLCRRGYPGATPYICSGASH